MAVLLHDATEAYVGDVVKPLKNMLSEYPHIERSIESAIQQRFNVDFTRWKNEIREIDHAVLIAERKALFSRDHVVWTGENEVRVISLPTIRSEFADTEEDFIRVYDFLATRRNDP